MRLMLDDVLSSHERLELWLEMKILSNTIEEYCNWWWRLDEGLRQEDARRSGVDAEDFEVEISE